jgi:FkbM family methyltransferase
MPPMLIALKRRIRWLLGRDLYVEPEIRVPVDRFGSPGGDGSWTLASDGLHAGSVVYTFGVGENISCERELIARYGLTVYAFDPTPNALAWLASNPVPSNFVFHPFGVADYDGTAHFAPPMPGYISFSMVRGGGRGDVMRAPVRRLKTLQQTLGLPAPDLLKMDIEGAEYAVLGDVIASGYRPAQILVEFHHRYRETGARKTREAIALLREAGYRIAFVSGNGMEYTFVQWSHVGETDNRSVVDSPLSLSI